MLEWYLWRHNYIIRIIITALEKSDAFRKRDYRGCWRISHSRGDGSPWYSPTVKKPDIVLTFRAGKRIILLEVTVSFETNIDKAHKLKTDRYVSLASDLTNAGYNTSFTPFEIGSCGLITKSNKCRLNHLLRVVKWEVKYKSLKEGISKSSITSFFSIFHSRYQREWNVNTFW